MEIELTRFSHVQEQGFVLVSPRGYTFHPLSIPCLPLSHADEEDENVHLTGVITSCVAVRYTFTEDLSMDQHNAGHTRQESVGRRETGGIRMKGWDRLGDSHLRSMMQILARQVFISIFLGHLIWPLPVFKPPSQKKSAVQVAVALGNAPYCVPVGALLSPGLRP